MALLERTTGTIITSQTDPNAVNEVQTIELNDIGSGDTFTLTHGGTTTGTLTYNATPATLAGEIETALEGLASITSCSVSGTDDDTYVVTFTGADGGKNMGAITITGATGFTPTGVTETTKGRAAKTVTLAVPGTGQLAEIFRVRAGLFENGSTNDISITDAAGRSVFSVTGVDTNVSGQLYDKFIGQDGQDQAGNASANVGTRIFEGPLTVVVKTDAAATGAVRLYMRAGQANGSMLRKFTTQTLTTDASGNATGYIKLSDKNFGIVRGVLLDGFDSSTDYTIEDANGGSDKVAIFTDTAIDATSGSDFSLGQDGLDQSGNAAADFLPAFVRGPLKVTIANGGNATTGSVTVLCEVN